MIIRNLVTRTLKASTLNSRRSERPADRTTGGTSTLKGSPVHMGDYHLNGWATLLGSMPFVSIYPGVLRTLGY